jgi:general secretion pathway protein F
VGAFQYTALDASGRQSSGILEGDTARQVRQLLRERALLPVTVAAVSEREKARKGSGLSLTGRVSAAALALFTRQLATLVKAGLPLEESLFAVSQQTEKPRMQTITLGVRARVMEGHTLADGLHDFPRVFPEIYRATVSAGQQTGHLDTVLERLADYTESREEIRQKVLGAMLYPITLTVLCLAIVTGLLAYVVPKVVNVFESSHAKLPIMTQLLIAVSGGLRHYGLYLLIAIVLVAVGINRALARPGPRRGYHRLLLRLPLIGKLTRGFNTARFTRTLSILTTASVPVLDALRIAGEVVTNMPMRDAVAEASLRVREGASISRSLAVSRLFPPMTIHLIGSGESSGKLANMLERAAISQERELDGLLTAIVGLLGPGLIVLMGIFVMGIVFAMLLPIFQMNQLIR